MINEYDIQRIKEIETRFKNTTKGQWIAKNIPYNVCDDPYIENENGTYIAQTVYDSQSDTEEHNINEDTIFIANAKNDISYLVQLLKEQVEELYEI